MIQSNPLRDMAFTRLILVLNLEYRTRESPISKANVQGPDKSPTVFETCKPNSANAEAH